MSTKTKQFDLLEIDLPASKHLDASKLSEFATDSLKYFRRGEKGLFGVLKILLGVGVLAALGVWVVPAIFTAIAKVSAAIASIVLIGAFIMALPKLFKLLRKLTRALHEMTIAYRPFDTLREGLGKMRKNLVQYRTAKDQVKNSEKEMRTDSKQSEKNAQELQAAVLSLNEKAKEIKSKMEAIKNKLGEQAHLDDTYQNLKIRFAKTVSEGQRAQRKYNQEVGLVQKFGSRANILKKVGIKLSFAETAMELKILDFSDSIDILEKDFKATEKMNEATGLAKSTLMFENEWEVKYATDVVSNMISEEISNASGNIKDIEMLTANVNMDSDALFLKLDKFAESITTGEEKVPDSKKYQSDEYMLTQDDQDAAGGFENLDLF